MSSVLIVEDEAIIALVLEQELKAGGYEVCGIASSAQEAIALAERHSPDIALVDVRLAAGSSGVDAAVVLERLGTAVVFATGHCDLVAREAEAGIACLRKPFDARIVIEALKVIEDISKDGEPHRPLPPNMQLLPH